MLNKYSNRQRMITAVVIFVAECVDLILYGESIVQYNADLHYAL